MIYTRSGRDSFIAHGDDGSVPISAGDVYRSMEETGARLIVGGEFIDTIIEGPTPGVTLAMLIEQVGARAVLDMNLPFPRPLLIPEAEA